MAPLVAFFSVVVDVSDGRADDSSLILTLLAAAA